MREARLPRLPDLLDLRDSALVHRGIVGRQLVVQNVTGQVRRRGRRCCCVHFEAPARGGGGGGPARDGDQGRGDRGLAAQLVERARPVGDERIVAKPGFTLEHRRYRVPEVVEGVAHVVRARARERRARQRQRALVPRARLQHLPAVRGQRAGERVTHALGGQVIGPQRLGGERDDFAGQHRAERPAIHGRASRSRVVRLGRARRPSGSLQGGVQAETVQHPMPGLEPGAPACVRPQQGVNDEAHDVRNRTVPGRFQVHAPDQALGLVQLHGARSIGIHVGRVYEQHGRQRRQPQHIGHRRQRGLELDYQALGGRAQVVLEVGYRQPQAGAPQHAVGGERVRRGRRLRLERGERRERPHCDHQQRVELARRKPARQRLDDRALAHAAQREGDGDGPEPDRDRLHEGTDGEVLALESERRAIKERERAETLELPGRMAVEQKQQQRHRGGQQQRANARRSRTGRPRPTAPARRRRDAPASTRAKR